MATGEAAPASLGPRYAPDDPTLPQPWKGLIDGTTGLLYYWNPETNITQYEKPTAVPPLPQGPPPVTSTSELASVPGGQVVQPNGGPQQQGQQMNHTPQQQGQQMNQTPQQQGQHTVQLVQIGQLQQGHQAGPAMHHQGQLTSQHLRPQMIHQPNQQMFPQPEHQMGVAQLGNQIPQRPILQQANQQVQMPQGTQLGPPQGYQFAHQPMQHMSYQQNMPQQGQHSSLQPTQHPVGQQFPNQQDHNKSGFAQREDDQFQRGHKIGYSPSQGQQGDVSSFQNPQAGTNTGQMPQMGVQPAQAAQFGSAPVNMQQPTSFAKPLQTGGDLNQQQHGPMFHGQMGPGLMHGRPSDDRSMGVPQQPKLAAIPVPRNQQELRMGNLPSLHSSGYPGGLNPVAGPPMQNMFSNAAGVPPFPNNAFVRPQGMMGSTADGSPVEAYRRKYEVTATGHNVPDPFISFEATGFPQEILREIHSAGFAAPTPIQAQTWPIALQNRDIVAIAKTGSGKTLGYLIPAFMLLRHLRNNSLNGPTVVVLAPTRELATQIQEEVLKFGRSSKVSCTCLYGGAPKALQLKELDRGADIIVATPGRLNDILEMKKVDFRQVSLLVLDEADRMLDMGFEPQIRKIVNEIPPRRQTLMYTATWPKEVRKIANDLLVNPVQVNIGNVDELEANKSITQHVEVVHQATKERRLEQILRSQERGSKIIIFCATKRLCDQLTRTVGRSFGAAAIHGDKNQSERDWVLNQFRSGKSPILVATDVAARGLDIKDIRVVVNYDFPNGVEDYVHRIGRTGRAGATGVAYTFFTEQDWKHSGDLIKVLEGANQSVPQELRDIASRGGPSFSKDRGGMMRFDSGSDGGERWDSTGRGGVRDGGFTGGRGGMRDGNFGSRDGMRDGGFGGRGGMRDSGFGGRGGMRDGGFGGRGGMRDSGFGGRGGMRDGGFGGRGGMRDGGYGGRGGPRGGGFGGNVGFDRSERRPSDRYNNMDTRGRGSGPSGGRFDNKRDSGDRSRGRSYSPSPERVRTWGGYSRSRSRSYSPSRSRSYSRSRSWSRSRSPRRSRSPTPIRRVRRRESKFDQMEPQVAIPTESSVPVSTPATIDKIVSGANPVNQSESGVLPQADTNPVTEP